MESAEEKILIQAIVDNIMDETTTDDSSSSETSSSESTDYSSNHESAKRGRINTFMQTVDQYNETDFKKHFKLSRKKIAALVDLYKSSNYCPNHNSGGRVKVGANIEIHIFLWYVSNISTYRNTGILFGLNQVTIWRIVNRVASWMVSISNRYIIWPRSTQRIEETISSFETLEGMPGVFGVIDSRQIKIKKPSENPEIYYNKKGYYSITLQAVVDSSKRFIDVYCGEPGSMSDVQILRRSPLFRYASDNLIFGNNSFLLGDSAYPSKSWLVPPYKDNGNLTDQQKQFNMIHSSTRIVVENAFRLMKGRFRRLFHFTEQKELSTVKNIVVACCMLHNISVDQNDSWFDISGEETVNEANSDNHQFSGAGDCRQEIINQLILKNVL